MTCGDTLENLANKAEADRNVDGRAATISLMCRCRVTSHGGRKQSGEKRKGGFKVKDYSKYSIEELEEMSKTAFSEYYRLATKPSGGQPPKSELDQLQKVTDTYESILEEIEERLKR